MTRSMRMNICGVLRGIVSKMKQDNINYFAVGLFVLIALMTLMVVLYRITGRSTNADEYFVELHNVSGIRTGSPVTYAGFVIGQLGDIEPVRKEGKTRYRLQLLVKSGWPIPDDSSATIVTPGLLAEKQVDISEGSSMRILKPGATIAGVEATDMFKLVNQMSSQLQQLSNEGLRPLLDTLNREITSTVPQLTQQTAQLLKQLNASADRMLHLLQTTDDKRLDAIVSNTETMTNNLLKVSERLSSASAEVDKLLQSTTSLMKENNKDLRQAVLDLRTSMDVVAGNINSVVTHIDTTARNMSEFSRQIRSNPAVILNGKPPKDAATQ
ncbi:MAG: MCE family protein [Gammaproteobacteria bacterium]|nr:MCE family protein [Gammaproteobacteria bacterium]